MFCLGFRLVDDFDPIDLISRVKSGIRHFGHFDDAFVVLDGTTQDVFVACAGHSLECLHSKKKKKNKLQICMYVCMYCHYSAQTYTICLL